MVGVGEGAEGEELGVAEWVLDGVGFDEVGVDLVEVSVC